jgi:hypothetical protein
MDMKGFRQMIGNPFARSREDIKRFRQLTYTCLETLNTRFPETVEFPKKVCRAGIMATLRFPT